MGGEGGELCIELVKTCVKDSVLLSLVELVVTAMEGRSNLFR